MRAKTVLVALLVLLLPLRVLAFMPQLHCAMGQSADAVAASSDGCPGHDAEPTVEHGNCDSDAARGHGCSGGACCPPVAAAHGPHAFLPLPDARPPFAVPPAIAERSHVPPLPERPPSIC